MHKVLDSQYSTMRGAGRQYVVGENIELLVQYVLAISRLVEVVKDEEIGAIFANSVELESNLNTPESHVEAKCFYCKARLSCNTAPSPPPHIAILAHHRLAESWVRLGNGIGF